MLRAKQNFRIWRSGTEPRPLPATPPNREIERSNLTKEIEGLQTQLEEAGVRYAKERSQLEVQLTQEQQENRRLKDQVSKFRDVIINKGSIADDVVSDAVIIRRFCELRQNILKIIFKWYDVDIKPVISYSTRLRKTTGGDNNNFSNYGTSDYHLPISRIEAEE
jgi:hypothetical protein